MTNLEPGWLMKTCHEAHISVMADHHPRALKHLGIEPRATAADAVELAARMAERFEAWTGLRLVDVIQQIGKT